MRYLIAFFFSCLYFGCWSQEGTPFALMNRFNINGDAVVIGNNITSKNASKPYNDFSLLNDQIRIQYIDIDNNPSTFSSSSASLNIADTNAKLVSATLFWGAVYPYEKGSKKESSTEITYQGNDKRNSAINEVLLTTPDGADHQIKGNIIFDGYNNEYFKETAPYVCYSDITSFINKDGINGNYTVANVRATEGFVSGGSSSGWCIFLVYESEIASAKSIYAFKGFSYLNDSEEIIAFNDFKTIEKGAVNASIFLATLEGDGKLYRDQCAIYNPKTQGYSILRNNLRPAKNFFTGRITVNEKINKSRIPNGQNTLGFDLLEMKIPSGLIQNNQKTTRLKMSTKSDRYYLFFTAFKVELNEVFFLNGQSVVDNDVLNSGEIEPFFKNAEIENIEDKINEKLNTVSLNISGVESSYYVITNVFSKESNAEKWASMLQKRGYETGSFINPENNWHYVYVNKTEDIQEAYKTYKKLAIQDYFKEIWVFKVNL